MSAQDRRLDIRERQNRAESLDRLTAQRWLYGQAKKVENWRLVSAVAVAGLLFSGLAIEAALYSHLATISIVVLWFFDQVVLVRFGDGKKQEAAAIREDFDCFVLDLPWPKHSGVERPTDDRVRELVRMANEPEAREDLMNWYGSDDLPVEATDARLHCQRANCRWDGRLRREWIYFVRFVVGGSAVVALIVATLAGMSLLKLVLVTAAGLRLAAWLLTEQRAQSTARSRMEKLHGFLSRADGPAGRLTFCDIRLVQASIFEHRRLGPMVPDWFYRLRRAAHEALERS